MPKQPKETPKGLTLKHTLRGHNGTIFGIAWSPEGETIASGSSDNTIGVWNTENGKLIRPLEGHKSTVWSVYWSPDGRTLASGSSDKTVRLWDTEKGKEKCTLEGHSNTVFSVSWSPDGCILASASVDKTIRLWDATNGKEINILKGHESDVNRLSWSPDGKILASGSSDKKIILWEINNEKSIQAAKIRRRLDHQGPVYVLSWPPNGRLLASSSGEDRGVIWIWDPYTGRKLNILEGHRRAVTSVDFSCDGYLLASKSQDGTVRIWRTDSWEQVVVFDEPKDKTIDWWPPELSFHPSLPILATLGEEDRVIRIWELDVDTLLDVESTAVHYINAKAVLVGNSGVGKSGLGIRMVEEEFRETKSTHGAQFWHIKIPEGKVKTDSPAKLQAELTLWDLAGQPEYRLTHQLFLDDVDVAFLLFDCSDPVDPFKGVPYWAKVLKKQAPEYAVKFLVSARCDVSAPTVSQKEINKKLSEYGLHSYLRTSAFTGEGVDELYKQFMDCIPWDKLTKTTTPRLFQIVRDFLMEQKEQEATLVSMDIVRQEVNKQIEETKSIQGDINTVVSLLQTRGLVFRLDPTPKVSYVLLKPELVNQYTSSIIQAARNHPKGIGSIPEREVICADLTFSGFDRLEKAEEEKILLESAIELCIRRDLCFREMGVLVFPSQLNITRPPYADDHPPSEVSYLFSGSVETIYASLVVRLSYTGYFHREDQWKYAAEFSRKSNRLGFAMNQVEEGTGELEIYFYEGINKSDRVTFISFITDHLRTKGIDIQERIRLYCPKCKREVKNKDAIETRIQEGELDILCQYCETSVLIPQSVEELYRSDQSYERKQKQLAKRVEKRTKQVIKKFKKDQQQYTKKTKKDLVHILHLSDIHLGTPQESLKYSAQLNIDLIDELEISHLEYLVISGDIAHKSIKEEYDAAFDLIDGLVNRFGLNPERLVIVPGNHDLNWDLSEEAYPFTPRSKLPDLLPEGKHIPAGEAGALVQNEDLYKKRFANFSDHFYKKIYGEYPFEYSQQFILNPRPEDKILFLALNSSWQIDHYEPHRVRASINMEALANAINQLNNCNYDGWLKIAVWHHPVTGQETMNDEFMQQLSVKGFQMCMHGHVHEAGKGFYEYDSDRGLHIIGAGTFGAPLRNQAGIPLQYNLLTLDKTKNEITVNTRRKEKPDGAWSADARWGSKNKPIPYYSFNIKTK